MQALQLKLNANATDGKGGSRMTNNINNKTGLWIWTALITLISWVAPVEADDPGRKILENECVSCHTISPKAPLTLKELQERTGSFFFGNQI